MIVLGRLAIAGLLALALAAGLIWSGAIVVPSPLNPLAPLRVADDPNWLTRFKLSRLESEGAQCLTVLAQSPISYKVIADRPMGQGCGFSNAVDISRSALQWSRGFTATCPLAAAWALFETHVLLPAARQHLAQDIVRVTHLGTYACRNVNNRPEGRRSEHATANAIDIAGFVLADGQRIAVKDDWSGTNPNRAFLRAIRDGACGIFDVVLSPDYNEAHHDHLHLDMGSHRACR
jgi:hypothetical protein